MQQGYLSVADAAKEIGVSQHAILGWLASGELIGIDVSRGRAQRRRWRIRRTDWDAFLAARCPHAPKPPKRRRVTASSAPVVEYF